MKTQMILSEKTPSDADSRRLRERITLALGHTYEANNTTTMSQIYDYICTLDDDGSREICLRLIPCTFQLLDGNVTRLDELFRWVWFGEL